MKHLALLLLIWIGFFVSVDAFSKMYTADTYAAASTDLTAKGYYVEALANAKRAVNLNPLEANYYRLMAKSLILTSAGKELSDVEVAKAEALKNLKKAYELNPNNLVTLRDSVPLYYFLAIDLSLGADGKKVDTAFLPIAKEFFDSTKVRYKDDAGVLVLVAKYEKRLGLTDDFNATRAAVEKLRPDLLEWNESLR